MSRPSPKYLLACLVTRYQRGHVSQAEAAKKLNIQKKDFGDLVAWQTLESALWRYYLARFNHAFPECDRAAVMRPIERRTFAPRMFTDTELMNPPKRELENDRPC